MLKRINLTGNPNLGVYIAVNEDVAIVPNNILESKEEILKEALDVDVVKCSIAGSNLAGALLVGNSNGFIVSPFIYDRELATLKEAGIENIVPLPDKYTAVGNILVANDNGAIISPKVSETAVDVIEETLDVDVTQAEIAGYDIIGSLVSVTNKGFLTHKDSSPEDLKLLEDTLGVEGNVGTVNRGIPLVGACSVSNSKGVIVGEDTTGPEMARIEESLGFLDSF
ncbi:MAG: translation initiation factor IF-6 [Methanobrevibacter boviskoreani]|uniref:translation initiation factor IF-6 n=1 Tax=Methanobrevibacter boviskoreani TaxID=1348249 RepID=UPI0023A8F205|nr:translation initiation factor IF-6 [Methanobrevibacter boviskoreani]MCI6931149.1 translation initiation factor IF-6 [Methanobrevibacter boviskoreani]